jgi:hypothetical protein
VARLEQCEPREAPGGVLPTSAVGALYGVLSELAPDPLSMTGMWQEAELLDDAFAKRRQIQIAPATPGAEAESIALSEHWFPRAVSGDASLSVSESVSVIASSEPANALADELFSAFIVGAGLDDLLDPLPQRALGITSGSFEPLANPGASENLAGGDDGGAGSGDTGSGPLADAAQATREDTGPPPATTTAAETRSATPDVSSTTSVTTTQQAAAGASLPTDASVATSAAAATDSLSASRDEQEPIRPIEPPGHRNAPFIVSVRILACTTGDVLFGRGRI